MANVTFTPNHRPAPACYPADANALLDMLTTGGGLSGTIPDNSGGGIYVGSSPPASSLTNKVWYKTDAAGRPLGVFMFYNGNWRKVYTGAIIGEIRMYNGSQAAFDGSGRGLIGGDLDGWAVCNGNNGTQNLVNYLPTAGAMGQSVGQPDGWYCDGESPGTWVTNGGAWGPHKIQGSNLPQLLTTIYGTPTNQAPGSGAYYLNGPDAVSFWYEDVTLNSPNSPLPFQPYAALAFIQFIGYQ